MQRLIDAAKELTRYLWKVQDWSGTYVEKRLDNIDAAISGTEQQGADDAELITEEWMVSEFKDIVNEDNRHLIKVLDLTNDGEINIGIEVSGCCLTAFFPYREDGHVVLPHIETRGQLRNLIKALKGGE